MVSFLVFVSPFKKKTSIYFKGKFTDAISEFDNNGPATLIIGSTEIKEIWLYKQYFNSNQQTEASKLVLVLLHIKQY